jgi:hypothetical protein
MRRWECYNRKYLHREWVGGLYRLGQTGPHYWAMVARKGNGDGWAAKNCGPKRILGCQRKIEMLLKYLAADFEFESKV